MGERKRPITSERLPEIYQAYLDYYQSTRQASYKKVMQIKRVLVPFEQYLLRFKIRLTRLRIEHIDAFLAEFYVGFAPRTCGLYRSYLRGFLRYLYHERGILRKDLAPLVVGAPMFSRAKPPKFLRPLEVKQLLANLNLSSPFNIQTCALVHLAYFLGLRPQEICRIRMKDISFTQAELTVEDRKNKVPIKLPLDDTLLKSIAAYVIGVRAENEHRELFLTVSSPHRPMCLSSVYRYISRCVKAVNPSASPYWLRHTNAQNLLESGASIFEIKEMLGHRSIESSRMYLHIHTKLMREVILGEEI
jgi:site-specific recombinase XerD